MEHANHIFPVKCEKKKWRATGIMISIFLCNHSKRKVGLQRGWFTLVFYPNRIGIFSQILICCKDKTTLKIALKRFPTICHLIAVNWLAGFRINNHGNKENEDIMMTAATKGINALFEGTNMDFFGPCFLDKM